MSLPRKVWLAALVGVLISTGVAWWAMDGIPHVSDEIVYTLQSRLLADGLRVGPIIEDPTRHLYPFWNPVDGGHGVFPIGWPLLLAVGELLTAPELVNPLLFGLAPLLSFCIARRLTPDSAVLAAWMVALSPAMWLLAASRMAQTSVMVALLAAAAVVVCRPARRWAWWGMGLAVGYVVLARPYDAVLLGTPLLLLGLLRGGGAAMVVLPGLAAGLILLDNQLLTGSALTFPVGPWFDWWVADEGRPPGCNRLGFGPDIGCISTLGSSGHTPAKALRIALDSAARLDSMLLGLPGGLLAIVPGLLVLRRRAWPLLAPLGILVAGYALYWSPGMAYGARFWHAALPGVLILAAAGVHRYAGRLAWLVLLLPLVGLSRLAPELSDYWCVDRALSDQLDAAGVTEGIVFVRSEGQALRAWPALGVDDFTCAEMLESGDAFHRIDPAAAAGGVQVHIALPSLPQTRDWLAEHHPGTPAFLAFQDLRTDLGWRLVRITAEDVEALP